MSANDKVAATFHGQADLPFGTPVTYWPGVREGAGIESVTRSAVWMVCGQPVVLVEGYSGGIALTHIERRKAPRPVEELVGVLTDPDWDKSNGKLAATLDDGDAVSTADEAFQRYQDGDEEYSDAVEHPEAGEPLASPKPDLTPEQDLRAAVADMLADADHFTGCTAEQGMTNCVCLVGRLHWAIGADEVPA